jgi:DNA-binding LacI/PurR family transcriptional regulator
VEERADCVAVDDVAGMSAAVSHLYALGHRAIAHATGRDVEERTRVERHAGFTGAMRAHGLRGPVLSPEECRPSSGGALARLRARVSPAGPITAITADNDLTAIRLIDDLGAAGVRVPEDVSVVGFDGTDLGAHPRIALTTVEQPRTELTQGAVALLLERIELGAAAGPPRRVTLEPKLTVRGSTAPPAA